MGFVYKCWAITAGLGVELGLEGLELDKIGLFPFGFLSHSLSHSLRFQFPLSLFVTHLSLLSLPISAARKEDLKGEKGFWEGELDIRLYIIYI